MVKKLLFAIFLLVSHILYAEPAPAGNIHAENTNVAGFSEICTIYTTASNSAMNITQLSDYIFSNISKRVKSKDALEAHQAVMQLDTTQRYQIFKQSAELSLKHSWDCAAMKTIMGTKK